MPESKSNYKDEGAVFTLARVRINGAASTRIDDPLILFFSVCETMRVQSIVASRIALAKREPAVA